MKRIGVINTIFCMYRFQAASLLGGKDGLYAFVSKGNFK